MNHRPATWPQAASDLARRVGRRKRLSRGLHPFGIALLAGAAIGMALRLAGVASPLPEAALGLAALVGILAGARGARRVRSVAPADAAWALDRLAGAQERGLVAATVPGPVGAEAAWAPGRVDPPAVRLLPPRGLAVSLCGALAVALAILVPAGANEAAPPAPRGADDAPMPGTRAAVADQEARAREDAAQAQAAAAVRAALGLGPQAATDPARVAERLTQPDVRSAAGEAAPEGSELAALLSERASADEVAGALAAGRAAEARAREARRQAAAVRAGGAFLAVPPNRRGLIERYALERSGPLSSRERGGR